jgi:hypothetical protein
MKYVSYYVASTGQPVSGLQGHTSKRAAISRARALRSSLVLRSGGEAVAERRNSTGEPTSDPPLLYEWYEHAEGGYRTA